MIGHAFSVMKVGGYHRETHSHHRVLLLCAVYVNDVLDLFGDSESQGLLLLVPVRLGSEALNPIYIPCVKVLLLVFDFIGCNTMVYG